MVSLCPRGLVYLQVLRKCVANVTTKRTGPYKSLDRPNTRLCSTSCSSAHIYCKRENSQKLHSLSAKNNELRGFHINLNNTFLSGNRCDFFKRQAKFGCLRNQIRHCSQHSEAVKAIAGVTPSGWYAAICDSVPVACAQEFLLKVHELSGFSWWSTIILSTILLRTCITLPLALYQHYLLAKLENLRFEMDGIVGRLKKEADYAVQELKKTEKSARAEYNLSVKKQWKQLIERDNCHPLKTLIIHWIQIPVWLCMSVGIRNLVYMLPRSDTAAQLTFLELSGEGALWFHNLVIPDATFLLPIMLGLSSLIMAEWQRLSTVGEPTKWQKRITNFIRGLSICMIPIAALVPSCLSLYWLTSNALGLTQNIIIVSPKLRRFCGIPPCASVPENPYAYIAAKLRLRFGH